MGRAPEVCLSSFDELPPPVTDPGTLGAGWSGGIRVYGGSRPTSVDLDDLDTMTRTLRVAADRLDAAATALRRAAALCSAHLVHEPGAARPAFDAVTAAGQGVHGPGVCADELRDLAVRVRHAVASYDGAESFVAGMARAELARDAALVGSSPLLAATVAVGAAALAATGVAVLAGTRGLLWVTSPLRRSGHGDDPLLAAFDRSVGDALGPLPALPDRLAADGRGTWEVTAAAAFLQAALGSRVAVPLLRHPVPATARDLASRLGDAPPTVVVPRVDPPQLDPPRTTADVLGDVAATYTPGSGGRPGTPPGTITVQRLEHPDGTVGWVVAVPGTQAWVPGGAAPTDLTTNLREVGGVADDMTTATVEAMRLAGVQPGDRVLVAGHSQGGMTAMSVAAAVGGYYDVRAVLTAGSPDVPGRVPPGVQVRAYRHTEDVVPQLDGRPDEGGRQQSVVTRRLAATGGPAHPTVAQAHSIREYVRTARLADRDLAGSPAMRAYDEAQAQVLGPPGTTQTTLQFQATRDPALAATDPATGLPRPPRIEPVYPVAR
ncbi:hypothetical protein [Cellulomonas alba]|uniref:Uncharacterized protein n=1 Tax=Cellulomonas alba TaxID=3053467 RepID=A0ABT7SFE6_9CELL|nr:hypothetical protein [Cellulomonas alba]MDM7854916.1 hypothetical protein [Cellulomonas alba]